MNEMVGECWRRIKEALLQTEERQEAEHQARCLLCGAIGCGLGELSFQMDRQLRDEEKIQMENWLQRRLSGEPLQYLLGSWGFMGLEFAVSPGVLIPRQDTETLVEYALQLHKKRRFRTVLDLCCGSGCIGISLAKLGGMDVTLTDIEPCCVELTRKNAVRNGVSVQTCCGDLFAPVTGTFDLIVSNPPYLTKSDMDTLQKEVRFEPTLALYGGTDGLAFYRRIAERYRDYLNPGGVLLLEVGAEQGETVKKLIEATDAVKDINGIVRVIGKDLTV